MDLRGHGVRLVLGVEHHVLGQASHAGEEQLRVAADQLRPSGKVGVESLDPAVVERQDVVLPRLLEEQGLQLRELLGLLGGEIVRLRPVAVGVELPHVVLERRQLGPHDPRRRMAGDGGPAVVVDAAVAEHLEVLRRPALGGAGLVERIAHAHALDRRLLDAVHVRRLGQSGGLEHRRRDVDHMVELRPHLAARGEAVRPVHDRAVARSAPVRSDLLRPLVGRVHRVRPADRVVVVGLRRPEVLDA